MKEQADIRWKQRFANFDRAYVLLRSSFDGKSLDSFSDLEREGLIQRFEYSYELAWKTMKDYLQENGVVIDPMIPSKVIKEAYAAKVVDDGQVWTEIGRASCRKECVSTCRSRWSPYH